MSPGDLTIWWRRSHIYKHYFQAPDAPPLSGQFVSNCWYMGALDNGAVKYLQHSENDGILALVASETFQVKISSSSVLINLTKVLVNERVYYVELDDLEFIQKYHG